MLEDDILYHLNRHNQSYMLFNNYLNPIPNNQGKKTEYLKASHP